MNDEIFYKDFIKSANKKKPERLRVDMYGFLVCIILDFRLFKKNSDLHNILDRLVLEKNIKDYLYASRTQLLARIIREFNKMDDVTIRKNLQIFSDFLSFPINPNSEAVAKNSTEKEQKEIAKNLDLIRKYRRRSNES